MAIKTQATSFGAISMRRYGSFSDKTYSAITVTRGCAIPPTTDNHTIPFANRHLSLDKSRREITLPRRIDP